MTPFGKDYFIRIIFTRQYQGEKKYQIDLSGNPKGGYHIIIKTESDVFVKKLMIISE